MDKAYNLLSKHKHSNTPLIFIYRVGITEPFERHGYRHVY